MIITFFFYLAADAVVQLLLKYSAQSMPLHVVQILFIDGFACVVPGVRLGPLHSLLVVLVTHYAAGTKQYSQIVKRQQECTNSSHSYQSTCFIRVLFPAEFTISNVFSVLYDLSCVAYRYTHESKQELITSPDYLHVFIVLLYLCLTFTFF